MRFDTQYKLVTRFYSIVIGGSQCSSYIFSFDFPSSYCNTGEFSPYPVNFCRFIGSAGQSFGCFLTPGINLRLIGEANDYVAKVLYLQGVLFILSQ